MQWQGNFSLVPPSAPTNLSVDSIGATWAYVLWQHLSMSSTTRYNVLVMMNGNVSIESTTTNQTYLNVTGLQPNVEYSFRVREVSTVHGDDNYCRSTLRGHSMSNQHKKMTPPPEFDGSKAPIEKLDHTNFWPHSSSILGSVVTWKSWFWLFSDYFSYALALITGVACITEIWLWYHFKALSMPYQMIWIMRMILKVKENSSRA
jgi:hypothetical protein